MAEPARGRPRRKKVAEFNSREPLTNLERYMFGHTPAGAFEASGSIFLAIVCGNYFAAVCGTIASTTIGRSDPILLNFQV